jgi:adenosine deaminase
MDYLSLPKIELHLHLDCSLSIAVAQQLDPTLDEASYRKQFIAPAKCTDLAEYLKYANAAIAQLQTEQALRLATLDLLEQLQRDNVIYAEIRFAPLLHLANGLTPTDVVRIVTSAARAGQAATGVSVGIILCTLRHFTAEQSLETARLAEAFRQAGVVGLDLAGDEAGFPIDAHVAAFTYARSVGLNRTAHAGEARGSESVSETLRLLQPLRLGHGIRSQEDPELIQRLQRDKLHLEICPTSNVQTNVVQTIADHPVDKLFRKEISLSINTDGRTLSHTTLSEEYRKLGETFGWGTAHFLRCNLAAIEHAFTTDKHKAELRQRIAAGYY